MQIESSDVLQKFNPRKIIWPLLIGLSVAAWLFYSQYDATAFQKINWTWQSTWWITLALFSVFVRDFAYMVRIRELTDYKLTWYRSFIVIMLWEFSSALAPAILGGGFFFAIYILSREKINMGKSITAIMFTSFLDGIFLAVMAPLVYFTVGKERLFSTLHAEGFQQLAFGRGFYYSFWGIYFLIIAYKLFVAYALFINPKFIKQILIRFFSLRFFRRWRNDAIETGNQLIIASAGLKNKSLKYWMVALIATFVSWTARYTIVNCIIMAFDNLAFENLVIYARQVVMGVIMLGSPTPGGSGVAEFMFADFLGEFVHKGLAPTLGILWRVVSYYPYLIIGAFILPRWIKEKILEK
jgi:glycosyltransferase 2 family protein